MKRSLLRRAAIVLITVIVAGCGFFIGKAFSLVSPADGSLVAEEQPVFAWTSAPNATSYTVQIRNAAGATHWQKTVPGTDTTLVYDGPRLANGETYRWSVAAAFPPPTGSRRSEEWRFTKVARGPMEATLVAPPNGASIVVGNPLFNWQAPAGGTPTAYKLEVRDPGGILVWNFEAPGTTTSATYAGPALLNGTTYRWKVVAVHTPPNPPAPSAEWAFTKVPIEAPLLVSPPNGGSIGQYCSFVFSWTAVAAVVNTERYIIEVRRTPGDVLVWSTAVLPPATSIAAPGVVSGVAGTYRWRVAAVAKGDATPSWSNFWGFTITDLGPCPTPTPTPTPTPPS